MIIILKLAFINFIDNISFYNFLNDYQKKYPSHFKRNFQIEYIEGNFPHSFFTQYNYLKNNNYTLIDKRIIFNLIINYNNIPICLDLNNYFLQINDLTDKYLLMILLTLHNRNNYIHCNNHYICQLLYSQGFNYTYIDDTYCQIINKLDYNIKEEEKIYNFSKIKTNIKEINNIDITLLKDNAIYKIMENNIENLINILILPEYQFLFYKEYLQNV